MNMSRSIKPYIRCVVLLISSMLYGSEEHKELLLPKTMVYEASFVTIDGRPATNVPFDVPYPETAAAHLAPIIAQLPLTLHQRVTEILATESADDIAASDDVEKADLIKGMVKRGLQKKNAALRAGFEQQAQEQIDHERHRISQTSCRWAKNYCCVLSVVCLFNAFLVVTQKNCQTS